MQTVNAAVAPVGWGKSVAKASWASCVIAIGARWFLAREAPVGGDLVALAFILLGLVLGIVALVRMAWEGRAGILVPALIGVVLNGGLILIFVSNFLAVRARGG